MKEQKEIVFEILGEGGGIKIERIKTKLSEKFIYHHNEFDPTEEGLDVNEKGEYNNFEQPFQIINQKYYWYMLHLETVNEEFQKYVADSLILKLQKHGVSKDDLRHSKSRIEEVLKIFLEFGQRPLKDSLQNIKVQNIIKLIEYDYEEFNDNYAKEIGQKYKLKGKFEVWFPNEQDFKYDQATMASNLVDSFETIGKLEVVGNSIIIKNEHNQIKYILPGDKFFISTTPILSNTFGWFYNTI